MGTPSDNSHLSDHQTLKIDVVVGLFTHVTSRETRRRLNHTRLCGVRGRKVLPRFHRREKHTSTHSEPAHPSFTHQQSSINLPGSKFRGKHSRRLGNLPTPFAYRQTFADGCSTSRQSRMPVLLSLVLTCRRSQTTCKTLPKERRSYLA
jgi:hypothetical protein